jgi:hypothetical protein
LGGLEAGRQPGGSPRGDGNDARQGNGIGNAAVPTWRRQRCVATARRLLHVETATTRGNGAETFSTWRRQRCVATARRLSPRGDGNDARQRPRRLSPREDGNDARRRRGDFLHVETATEARPPKRQRQAATSSRRDAWFTRASRVFFLARGLIAIDTFAARRARVFGTRVAIARDARRAARGARPRVLDEEFASEGVPRALRATHEASKPRGRGGCTQRE